VLTPNQIRWRPFAIPPGGGGGGCDENNADGDDCDDAPPPVDFVRGLFTLCGSGSPLSRSGYAIHVYAANASMHRSCLGNADGDLLVVPQLGGLLVRTEMGRMSVQPGEIAVVPAGIRFSVSIASSASPPPAGSAAGQGEQRKAAAARGYVLEVFGTHFVLPELGPIGANGLASPRDFQTPKAWYEDEEDEGGAEENDEEERLSSKRARKEQTKVSSSTPFTVVHKFGGELFSAKQAFSPFNVVAWHGNYAPYKYDLSKFCPMNAVSFDHPDPSIFTVLTAPSVPGSLAGPAGGPPAADFVIFPPRYAVARNTFRPPYYHRNTMNEFMGLIRGGYDGKAGGGFLPGGASLHLAWTPHGPDKATFDAATKTTGNEEEDNEVTPPARDGALAFMFEMHATPRVATAAVASPHVDREYYRCWEGLSDNFDRAAAAKAVVAASSSAAKGEAAVAVDATAGAVADANGS